MNLVYRSLLVVLLSLSVLSVALAADPAAEAFEAGLELAREGRYAQALVRFRQARAAGLDSPKLDYNLAVAHYRLGHYAQAGRLFRKLVDEASSLRQLAYYNLGLVANKRGDEAAAVAWFEKARALNDNLRVKYLAGRALQRLRNTTGAAAPRRPWHGFASLGVMHDSNVTLANDTLTGITGVSDTAAEALLSTSLWLAGNRRHGLRVSLNGYMQKYRQQGSNDFSQLAASLGRYQSLGQWLGRVYLRWEESYFGGASYQRAFSLDGRLQRPLGKQRRLNLRYRLSRLRATSSRFDYLDGWRQQLRLGQRWGGAVSRFKLDYQLELNDRRDRIGSTGNFASFSPTRHALRARLERGLPARWRASLEGRYRYSRYRGQNDLADGSRRRRIDQQYRVSLGLQRRLGRHWEFEARYNYTRNDSAIETYQYRRALVSAGINGFF